MSESISGVKSMRFFHLSDLHIGKQLHSYNLRQDQEHILQEVVSYAEKIRPDAIVFAGDIYDKSVPSAEAVRIFDEFLTKLSSLEPAIPILIIAGNHDSAQRLNYASQILKRQNIYIAGNVPETEAEYLKKLTLQDEEGKVNFYFLPFLKPGYVRGVLDEEIPESYEAAVRKILEREHIDWNERNVLISHQFYAGRGQKMERSESETASVGGLDLIDSSCVQNFDYVALGHLHGAQRAGAEHIRYCGTLLKYSVSEANQNKTLHLISLGKKEDAVQVEELPLHPLRNVRKVRGELEEIIADAKLENKDDYISVTLTDEVDPYKPKEQLERVYSHILEVRMDNTRTRKKLEEFEAEAVVSDPLTVFEEFFEEMQGRAMNEEEKSLLVEVLEEAGE